MVASGGKNQLSRNPGAQMAFDGAETLHVAYWRGGAVTNPNGAPSFVLYRSRTAAGVWSAEEILDNSESAGQHVGGRHPSLTVAPDGTVWVAWHDHRHGTQAGNWIDNLEIYADVKTPGGSFSATDLRLTTSSAAHLGDNGYMPRIASGEDGRLSVAWFDFHDNFDVSDIFLKTSDASGAFDLGESMDAARLTDLDDRGGTPLFVTPDLAIAPDGTRHLVWTSGTGPRPRPLPRGGACRGFERLGDLAGGGSRGFL